MKNKRSIHFATAFLLLYFPILVFSQEVSSFELQSQIHRVYPSLTIKKENLIKSQTLTDLNDRFESHWVKEYIKVELWVQNNGELVTAESNNDTLNHDQKKLLLKADEDSDVIVKVNYFPDNNLKENDSKEIRFTINIDPQTEASYAGGQKQLELYLENNLMKKLSLNSFRQYHLSAVKFSINKKGEIENPHLFESSNDEAMDELLLQTICNMQNWKPAECSNGKRVRQDFVLTIGDMNSCVINLLNINP